MPLAVGEVFAGYTILRVLGAGAMGTVYLVQHPRLPRRDALKVLSADLTADEQYRARFVREADIAAGLSHPNILGVHDRGESGGQFWIAMDFVDGTDAAQLLRERYRRGMPLGLAMQIITGVASALDYAHQRRMLHRDVKPANILIADPGSDAQRVFLADFGIARPVDDTAGLTATNIAVGTVAYAAPEQLMGEPIDERADQYALACTAFHLLTGTQPFDFPSAAVVITKHVMAPPPPIGQRRPELAALEPVFAQAMAKKPAERFNRCQDFTAQLQRGLEWGAGSPQPALIPTQFAPTQFAPTQFAPTQAAPVLPPPLPPPPAGKRAGRARVLVGALLAVALLVAGGIFAAVKLSGHPSATAPTATANSTAPSPGPFTGTYRSDYGPMSYIDGTPAEGATPSTITWGVRSVCRPTGCVATASRVGGADTTLKNRVFDDVGGSWLAVDLATEQCGGVPTEFWVVLILQPRPDGNLSGEMTKTSAPGCAEMRTLTITRTGEVDVKSVADPAGQAPRVASPAEALHGRYHEKFNLEPGNTAEYDWTVRTDCRRTGDRCMSYFHKSRDVEPLVFSDGKWTLDAAVDLKCPSGDMSHVTRKGEYVLPQPSQDPIMLLTGHGHQQQTGSCANGTEFDERLERTGD